MKGFNTSLDYSKLWDFIHNDFRIPAWILQSEILGNPIFDLVEVRMLKYRDYPIIGTRGISYSTMENTKEAFINNCKSLQMVFIIPKEELERGITITHVGKQETLEEVAEKTRQESFMCCSLSQSIDYVTVGEREKLAFIKGAKWQQERSYSEEDMLKSFMAGIKCEEDMVQSFMSGIKCESNNGKTFEQFIKKFKNK
jgi:hypothetical protein